MEEIAERIYMIVESNPEYFNEIYSRIEPILPLISKELPNFGESIHQLIQLINQAHSKEINIAKSKLISLSQQYECTVGKLQEIEINNNIENDSSSKSEEEDIESDNKIPFLAESSSDEEVNLFQFDHIETTGIDGDQTTLNDETRSNQLLTTAISSVFQITSDNQIDQSSQCDILNCTNTATISELKAQNKQYLALGISWKKKYESLQESIKKMTEDHVSELQRIYKSIGMLQSEKVSAKHGY